MATRTRISTGQTEWRTRRARQETPPGPEEPDDEEAERWRLPQRRSRGSRARDHAPQATIALTAEAGDQRHNEQLGEAHDGHPAGPLDRSFFVALSRVGTPLLTPPLGAPTGPGEGDRPHEQASV